MKNKLVGRYSLGVEWVDIYLRPGDGGNLYIQPKNVAGIVIGADTNWADVLDTLVHESGELVMSRMKCRFKEEDTCGADLHGYLFILHHKDWSDLCARLADIITDASRDLYRAWKEWRKSAKANTP